MQFFRREAKRTHIPHTIPQRAAKNCHIDKHNAIRKRKKIALQLFKRRKIALQLFSDCENCVAIIQRLRKLRCNYSLEIHGPPFLPEKMRKKYCKNRVAAIQRLRKLRSNYSAIAKIALRLFFVPRE